jgi:hypothetical protein
LFPLVASEITTVEELIRQLSEKTGIGRALAEKISTMLQQNAANLPQMLAGDSQGLVQLLQKAGIDPAIAQKVLAFLKQHAADLPAWLGSDGGGILSKAKEALGGMLGRKEGK